MDRSLAKEDLGRIYGEQHPKKIEGRKVWKPHRIGTLERCPSEPGGEGCAIS